MTSMQNVNERRAWWLSVIVLVLMASASAAGLIAHELYRDNALISSSWWGNDLVTLIVATPILMLAMRKARSGSSRARLVWMGMLAYSAYNGAFYLFGAAFNSLFLVYVATFTLSAFGLIFGLSALNVEQLRQQVSTELPARPIAGYMVAVGLLLGSFHGILSVQYVFTGTVPPMVETLGLRTNLIAALDLSMVVSVALLGGVWLWRRTPWGYILAVLWNVKGAVYMTALSAATGTTLLIGPAEDGAQLFLWIPIGAGSLIASVVLLLHLNPTVDGSTSS